jgi:hypothetical protein
MLHIGKNILGGRICRANPGGGQTVPLIFNFLCIYFSDLIFQRAFQYAYRYAAMCTHHDDWGIFQPQLLRQKINTSGQANMKALPETLILTAAPIQRQSKDEHIRCR